MNVTSDRISDQPTYNVPALVKGLDVLELLADAESMNLTALAQRLGRTKQELFRVVSCLLERGYLIRDAAQRYRVSTKLFELGSKNASIHALIAHAMPHMERLARDLGESCHLNIVLRNRMLVVARADSDADISLTVRVGATFDLHSRNTGQLILAYMPEEVRERYWQQSNAPAEQIEACEREILSIRKKGFIEANSQVTVGVRDCAAPILGAGGRIIGVLCVSHIVRLGEPLDRRDYYRAVVSCASEISREFGPDPEGPAILQDGGDVEDEG